MMAIVKNLLSLKRMMRKMTTTMAMRMMNDRSVFRGSKI